MQPRAHLSKDKSETYADDCDRFAMQICDACSHLSIGQFSEKEEGVVVIHSSTVLCTTTTLASCARFGITRFTFHDVGGCFFFISALLFASIYVAGHACKGAIECVVCCAHACVGAPFAVRNKKKTDSNPKIRTARYRMPIYATRSFSV